MNIAHLVTAMPQPSITLSALIRQFPWNNGITLHKGSMTEQLSRWLSDQPEDIQGIDTSLILVSHNLSSLRSRLMADDLTGSCSIP